jgi:hypothetical protein
MEKGKNIEEKSDEGSWFSPQNRETKKLISAIPGKRLFDSRVYNNLSDIERGSLLNATRHY